MGYFKDDYSHIFLKNKRKMLPIINRGTWARVFSVRSVITKFLSAFKESETVQILSLGAGFDVTYFWLRDVAPGEKNLRYYEVDFRDVVEKKI